MALGEGPLVGTARDALDYEFSARSTDAGVLLNAHFGRTQVRGDAVSPMRRVPPKVGTAEAGIP